MGEKEYIEVVWTRGKNTRGEFTKKVYKSELEGPEVRERSPVT